MTKALNYLYRNYSDAARVVAELEKAGIPHDDISIISHRPEDPEDTGLDRGERTGTGAATGAAIGGTAGATAGLLAGLGMLAIPGIGPVVAAGWLVSLLAVGAAGAATGGLIGALTGAGMSKEHADVYAEGIRRGGTLVTARVDDTHAATAEAIMQRYNPMDPDKAAADYRGGGWTGFDQQSGDDRIVAMFENADRARAARDALIAGGIGAEHIAMLDHHSDAGNWGAMKQHWVPDEDTHAFAEGLRRGHSILVIRPPAGEHDRVLQLIESYQPIDIDEYSAKWRQSCWSGVHPGKEAGQK